MRLSKNPNVIFSSISQRYIEVIAVTISLLLFWIRDTVSDGFFLQQWYNSHDITKGVGYYHELRWTHGTRKASNFPEDGSMDDMFRFWGAWETGVNSAVAIVVFYYGQLHFNNLRTTKKAVEKYDVRNAQLSAEEDRGLLLQHINDLFYAESGVTHHEGIDLFNDAVRTNVPEQLRFGGFRSWKLFRYMPAIVFFLQTECFPVWDAMSYGMRITTTDGTVMKNPMIQHWYNVVGVAIGSAFTLLILCPFSS